MTITQAAEIPTVSLLYRVKKLQPAPAGDETVTPQPSQSFNDRIGLIRGDITKLEVDAIVNAANNSLLGGGGVDGAIHRAAGPELLKECRTLGGCLTGSAKISGAYNLPCKKVIHSVGPVYDLNSVEECEKDLAGCYTTSLGLAVENECKTIAFSALSTGIYGYPSHDAAPVAIQAVKEFLESDRGDKLDKVIFVTFNVKDVDAYNYWLPHFFPSTELVGNEEDWEEVNGEESAENGGPEIYMEEGGKGSEESSKKAEDGSNTTKLDNGDAKKQKSEA